MDPTEVLRQIREEIKHIQDLDGDMEFVGAQSLADLVSSLDGWLSTGGFPPDQWANGLPDKRKTS